MSLYRVRIYPNSKSPRIFNNRFLELLTKTHPLIITILYLGLGVFMLWWYVQLHPRTSFIRMLVLYCQASFHGRLPSISCTVFYITKQVTDLTIRLSNIYSTGFITNIPMIMTGWCFHLFHQC